MKKLCKQMLFLVLMLGILNGTLLLADTRKLASFDARIETELDGMRPEQLTEKSWQSLKQVIYEQKIIAQEFDNVAISISLDPVNNRAVLGATTAINYGTDSGTAYVFKEENGSWVEEVKLLAHDGFAFQEYGTSVAIEDDWIAIGAPGNSHTILGHVYLYKFDGMQWNFFDKVGSGESSISGSRFGEAVRLSKDVLLVGDFSAENEIQQGSGAAFVFNYDAMNDVWQSPSKLLPANSSGGNQIARYVDINASADRIVLSAEWDNQNGNLAGAVYVFDWDGNNWLESDKLIGSNTLANSEFGTQVAISDDGNIIIARSHIVSGEQEVYIFEYLNNSWQETAIISDHEPNGIQFAHAIDVSDTMIAIGRWGPREISTYSKIKGVWTLGQIITGNANVGLYDYDIQGDRLLAANINIGANYFENLPVTKNQNKGSICQISACQWSEQGTLVRVISRVEDSFGVDIDVSGNYAIIGAHQDDERGSNAGSAYVYEYIVNSQYWYQRGKLTALDGAEGDLFGRAVAIDGNRAVVGAYSDDHYDFDVNVPIPNAGSVYVFERFGTSWLQTHKLIADEDLLAAGDFFGSAVDIQGDRIVVGARFDDENGNDAGAVYVFDFDGNNWNLEQKIMPLDGNADDAFGYSVSLDGNRFIAGAYLNDEVAFNTGAAYVYEYEPLLLGWTLEDKITPVFFGHAGDFFGTAVAIQGEHALVGALQDDISSNDNSGRVYYFKKDPMSENWLQSQAFTSSDIEPDDEFGYSIFMDGDKALIGAWREDENGMDAGAAYLFKLDANSGLWDEQKKIVADDGVTEDYFGVATAIAGDQLIVGAHRRDGIINTVADSGMVYIMTDDVIFKNSFD